MSEGDVWYFARGQEVVGPFSAGVIRQIHEGGQLPLETLVWREGMEGWKPAKEVVELGLWPAPAGTPVRLKPPSVPSSPSTPAVAPAAVPAVASPAAPAAPKLRMKARSERPVKEGPHPSMALRKSLAPDGESFPAAPRDPAGDVPVAGHGPRKRLSWFEKTVAHVFSSLVMTPLFLIAAAVLAILAGAEFPDILGLRWIFLAFGAFGVASLFGFRTFDGLFRWLALLVFVPPLAMFWPVIMREIPVSHVSGGQWFFLTLCFLYYIAMRIGLRAYLGGVGVFAVVAGLATLTILVGIWKTDLEKGITGWEAMVKGGAEVKMPGFLARWLNMPELGTREGALHLQFLQEKEEVGIERAAFESRGTEGWRFTMVLLNGQQWSARFRPAPEGTEAAAVMGKDAPLSVVAAGLSSREGLEEVDSLSGEKTLRFKGRKIDFSSGSLRLVELGMDKARGTVAFSIPGQKDGAVFEGVFETKMIRR